MTTDDTVTAPLPLAKAKPQPPMAPTAQPTAPMRMPSAFQQRLTPPGFPMNPTAAIQRARAPRVAPSAPVAGGGTITSTAGDGFGSPPPAAVPGGTTITSTAGDGFGSPPANPASPMAVDRFQLASNRWNNYVTNEATPQYQAALRQANRLGAAGGQLGAGELRTDFGNLSQAYNRDITNAGAGFLNDALEGTIGDRQQAFQNELASLGLSDDLMNSAFGRALQTYNAGNLNNPTRTGLAVGGYQAGNADRAGQSWADLLRLAGSAASIPNQTPGDATSETGNWQPGWDWRSAIPGYPGTR